MASAAVEMLTLDPCRKIMVFNTDMGLDSDTDTELMNNVNGIERKRAMSETEEDHDKGPMKKRRKQSKPVRIASSESHSDAENYLETTTPENRDSEYNVGNISVLSANIRKESVITDVNNDDYPEKDLHNIVHRIIQSSQREENFSSSDDSLLPINLSNAKSAGNDIFTNVVSSQKIDGNQNQSTINFEKGHRINEVASSTSSYPESQYEGSNFEKDTVFVNSSHSPLSFPVKSVHNVHQIVNSARHTASPVRIFNPEAFCDVCNKELCNKYFLKTHKANKHGIYSETPGQNLLDTLPSLPYINYYSNVNEVIPANNALPQSVLRKPPIPNTLTQPIPVYTLQKSIATANGNTRAFCNICQREFCNKYFVRRHKAKIHGIIDMSFPDTPPGEVQQQKSLSQIDSKLCSGNHEKSEDHEIYSSSVEQKMTPVNIPAVVSFSDFEKLDNRLCENKALTYVNEQIQSASQNKEPELDECPNSGAVRPISNVSPSMSTTSMYQQDEVGRLDANDKLKRTCVANSAAFCDICCKEYCNKYFLRTHKLKIHGILMNDIDKRDEKFGILDNNLSQGYNQSMPLNLIVGDQNSEKIEVNSKDLENEECFCEVCGQKFKNTFFLKMHTSYVHPQEKNLNNEQNIDLTNENAFKGKQLVKNDSNILTDSTNRMTNDDKYYNYEFQNVNLTMLRCEICHQEIESSLLESHIENVHGNLLEESAAMGEDNSNSQLFSGTLVAKYDCLSCQKQFSSTNLLHQHIIECHGTANEQVQLTNPAAKSVKETEDASKNNQLQSMYNVAEVQSTPTSSFCEICKKELCNKYFMKTHMQRMHGISIDNGAHIGGVVCDICNKELCSKYFLRVHKQNSHGIVDEILGLDISRNQSPSTDPSLRPNEQNDLSNRYFSHFTEVCTICSRRFRSLKWLKAHLLNDHGDEGKEKWREFQSHYDMKNVEKYHQDISKKADSINVLTQTNLGINNGGNLPVRNYDGYSQNAPNNHDNSSEETNLKTNVFTTIFNSKNTNTKQYNCSYCPFSTSILAFFFVHERSHMNGSNLLLEQNKKFSCKICSLSFDNVDSYEKHCVSHTLSEVTRASSSTNERISKTDQDSQQDLPKLTNSLETDKRDVAVNLYRDSNYLKTSLKITKEIRSEDSTLGKKPIQQVSMDHRQEFGAENNELDLESYDGELENSKKDPYEKYRQETKAYEMNGALSQVKQSLDFIANKTDIPVSFSVPQSQKEVIMQPFVLEDSGEHTLSDIKKTITKKSFLSSIVFLPVKERLTNPVTVSFKLTPT